MPKITRKGQVTIPMEIRDRFGFLPGTDVRFLIEDNKAVIVKMSRENKFLDWLGRGKGASKRDIDRKVDQLRGRTDGPYRH